MAGQLEHDHLLPQVRALLDLPDEERIAQIKLDSFIPYQPGERVLARMNQLMNGPSCIRPEGLLLTGPSGNGKTALLHEFVRRNPKYKSQEAEVMPVVFVEAPPTAGERRLLVAILQSLGYEEDYYVGDNDHKLRRVLNVMRRCSVRLLIIDEINSLLHGGKKLYESLNLIKNLANKVQRPIVLAGTKEAEEVIRIVPQVSSRFRVIELPGWRDCRNSRDFLYRLETTLPLRKPSRLYKSGKAEDINRLSESLDTSFAREVTLGNIIKLVKKATVLAIEDGTEQVLLLHLNAAAKEYSWSDNLE